ncbi:MAG: uroporphyrinogen-III synthase [Alphaproteobacteria bacterium]|jgi:hypothetical protein
MSEVKANKPVENKLGENKSATQKSTAPNTSTEIPASKLSIVAYLIIIIYELKFNLKLNLKPEEVDILTFFSPLSARYFLEYAQNLNILEAIKPLVIYTLSDSVAKVFSSIGCNNIYSAEKITGSVSADNLIKLIIDNERSQRT